LGLGILKGLINGVKWYVECDDRIQKRFLEKTIGDAYEDIIRINANILDFGFQSSEIIYKLRPTEIAEIAGEPPRRHVLYRRPSFVISHIKDHYPSSVRVVLTKKGEFSGIRQYQWNGRDVYLRRGFKLMFATNQLEFGNVFGRSRLLNANSSWYWGEIGLHFMMRYLERQGAGNLIARYPAERTWEDEDGNPVDAGDFALSAALAVSEHTVAALPQEFDAQGNPLWDLKYLESESRASAWERVLNYFDVQMLRGLCIPDRAVAQDLLPGSTSAGSESSRDLMLTSLSGTLRSIAATINRDIVVPLQCGNFLPSRRVPASFKFQDPDFDRRTLLKQILQEWIRQWPNFMAMGKFPKKVPALLEAAKILGVPIEDAKDVFDDVGRFLGDSKQERRRQRRETGEEDQGVEEESDERSAPPAAQDEDDREFDEDREEEE
jgi:hypothetical protein